MKIIEKLDLEHIEQLYEMYKYIWFTQDRESRIKINRILLAMISRREQA